MFHVYMLVCKQFWHYIQTVEPQELSWILEMVFLTLCPSMKDMLFHTLFKGFIWLVEISLLIYKKYWMRKVIALPQMLN